MSFLERELGVRFYTPRVTVAPRKARSAFVGLHPSERPGVRVRNDFCHEAFDPIWAARNRVNGAMSHRVQPGGLECCWAVHTFYPLLPPEEFFRDHPEDYSLLDGRRTADRAQLCLTNPAVLRPLTERIRQKLRALPEYLIYDVSQNDWSNPCECADTEAIRQRVELARLPILYLKCKRAPVVARQDGSYARLGEIVRREGITHYAEAGEPHKAAFHAEVEAAQ
jgi:hypothetical protein